MTRQLLTVPAKPLRDLGVDERWLQERVTERPDLLGLGNLVALRREKTMIGGGRLDLLLAEVGTSVRFEVELMLGSLDPSHLFRTLEYWDVERRRYPNLEHRAVVVAEDITSRYLNVISLLNKSVPLIALQMTALDLPDGIGLVFTKVLDLSETFEDAVEENSEGSTTAVTRNDWEEEGYGDSLKVVDAFAKILDESGVKPRITYTEAYVSIASTGRNFMWFGPQKRSGGCMTEFLVEKDDMDRWSGMLAQAGGSITRRKTSIKTVLNTEIIERQKDSLTTLAKNSEGLSRR